MSIYYDLYETPSPEGEEPKPLHARVCSKGTISGKDFMNQVFREEHMPHAMIVGIVQAITTTLGDWLANGYTVEVEGLGFFSTTLKCTRPAMTKKEVRAESVRLSTVKFRPSIEFKRYVDSKMDLERADKRFFPVKTSFFELTQPDARKQKMLSFLDANVCITRAEYARLVNVTDRRATSDLQEFVSSGFIRRRGAGRSVVYIRS
jgi:predicted histone-like DNA-binding protein